MTALTFRTIDIPTHAAECVRFRRDSYACSFEDGLERFAAENGADGADYLTWLAKRIKEFPAGCVHAWLGDRIVGQIESRLREDGSGKVNLFYLVPDAAGARFGATAERPRRGCVSRCRCRDPATQRVRREPASVELLSKAWLERQGAAP